MKPEETKQWFRNTIKANVESLHFAEQDYLKTVSENFSFQANGEKCDFKQWMIRLKSFKEKMKSLSVSFEHVIVEDHNVAALYFVKGTQRDKTDVVVKVIGFFKIKDDKLIYCDELTSVVNPPLPD